MTYLLTLIRHAAGVVAGAVLVWLGALLGLEVTAEAVAGLTEVLTWLGAGLMLLGYAAAEKALKPLFRRMGEPPDPPTGVAP